MPIFAEFSSLPKREWIRSSFPAAQGPIVGLSLSAIAIRRQKHLCAYRHLIGSPRCCFNVTLLKGEKGKLRSSKKNTNQKKQKIKAFFVVVSGILINLLKPKLVHLLEKLFGNMSNLSYYLWLQYLASETFQQRKHVTYKRHMCHNLNCLYWGWSSHRNNRNPYNRYINPYHVGLMSWSQ